MNLTQILPLKPSRIPADQQDAGTVLTMLGIIIGVAAVIVIVGLGNGMTQMHQGQLF